jgi:hypothetical protein
MKKPFQILSKTVLWSSAFLLAALPVYAATANNALGQDIKNAFNWIVGIVAVVAAGSFAWGAVEYVVSGAMPKLKESAKDRMRGSALGLIITLVAILILNMINPQIASLSAGQALTKQPQQPGIYFSNGNPDKDLDAPMDVNDMSGYTKQGYQTIKYVCSSAGGQNLIIFSYPNTNFIDPDPKYKDTVVQTISCNQTASISGKSVHMEFETDGVYFYLQAGCTGYQTTSYSADINGFGGPFAANAIKSMKIINATPIDPATGPGNYFEVILHDSQNASDIGTCTNPYYASGCHDVTAKLTAKSATIFNKTIFPQTVDTTKKLQNTGDSFYSKPWGWETGTYAGFSSTLLTLADDKNHTWEKVYTPSGISFSYKSCGIAKGIYDCSTQSYQQLCPDFSACAGSVQATGNVMTVFSDAGSYGQKMDASTSNCQVFRGDINNVKETEFVGQGKTINSIRVIPYQ